MAREVVLRAEGLSKKYIIGHQSADRASTLRDALVRGVSRSVRGLRDVASGRPIVAGDELEEFWALKDVNFEISRGDVVGIIGRNGAGKSTLLKILSRITEPSAGRVEIRGRVASLLEVGTGFHPELTGRENIFLNGAILGMKRAEIRGKFDEIVEFSEIATFLDTPVKRYSSGMYVRLAFAVAAHLEPEILVVDEVLAVGDAEFQKKCLGKMQDVAVGGRTVLFVSHNMAAVQQLCTKGMLISGGTLTQLSDTSSAIDQYLNAGRTFSEYTALPKDSRPTIVKAWASNSGPSAEYSTLTTEDPVGLCVRLHNPQAIAVSVTLILTDEKGVELVHTSDEFTETEAHARAERRCVIPARSLGPGSYTVHGALFVRNLEVYQPLTELFRFRIEPKGEAYSLNNTRWRGWLHPQFLCWAPAPPASETSA